MKNSVTKSRIVSCSAKGLIFAALVFPSGIPLGPALANGIQMLPPITEATKTYPDASHSTPPTVCPAGTPSILTWDGTNPISCATGVTVTGGFVGIGTTSPTSTLQIVNGGTAQLGSNVVLGEDTGRFSAGGLRLRNGVTDGNTTLSIMPNGPGFSDLRLYNTDDPTGMNIGWGEIGFSGNRSTLTFSTGSTGTGAAPTAFAFPDGKVGIGTTDPQATLDVNGTIKLGNGTSLIGSACSPVGAIEYDSTTDTPVYCSSATSTWKAMGGAQQRTFHPESYAVGVCYPNPASSGESVVSVVMNANGNGGDGYILTGPNCGSLYYIAGYGSVTKGAWGYNFGVQGIIPNGGSFEISTDSGATFVSGEAFY